MSTNQFDAARDLFAGPQPPLPELDRLAGFEMSFVKSNFIARVGYNTELGRLAIQFANGKTSIYPFPQDAYLEMLVETSLGKFYHARIRGKVEPIEQFAAAETTLVDGTEIGAPEEVAAETAAADVAPWERSEAVIVEAVSDPAIVPEVVVETAPEVTVEASEEEKKLSNKGQALVLRAEVVTGIVDQASHDRCAEIFAVACQMEKEIKDEYAEMKDLAFKAHRAVCDSEKRVLGPVLNVKQRLSLILGGWAAEQTRLKSEEERRLRLAAEKRAEDETLEIAAEARASGACREEVDMILENPTPVQVAPVAASYTPSFASKAKWKPWLKPGTTELLALKAVIDAAVKNPEAYLPCLMLNMREINARADRQKGEFNVPGFVARPETKATAKVLKGAK